MKKVLSLLLALVMVLLMLPWHVVALPTEEKDFAGKTVSILSHSASTYAGVSNSTAANSTIGNNDVYYTEGRHDVYLKDTWWQQTIDALGMRLLVNNSWSGSCVFMPRKGEASVGYGDRAVNLHNDRTGEEPDVIFVYLGCNDFAYYKDTFGTATDVDYAALIQEKDGVFSYGAPQTTCEAYAIMLHKVQTRYPDAEIYCMTSTARRETDYTGDSYPDAGQPTEYSAQLQKIAKHFGYPVIDLENAIPKKVEIFDKYMGDKRAHPNALGMDRITNEVLSVMLGKDAEICHVTSRDGVVAQRAVLKGGSYRAEVDLQAGYALVVTMDGKDITAEAVQGGKITVAEVTGDLEIHGVLYRDPMHFRWEMKDGALVSTGQTENPLDKIAGTVTDGLLSDGRYKLTTSVALKHDLPWVVEWKCAEDWRGVILSSDSAQAKEMNFLSRVNGGQLCFGTWTGKQYNNYGIDISGLDGQMHTYRLENRIAADGSNMVWLYVDEAEIGPMDNYFIGSNSQNSKSSWVSGKDFVYGYIGIENHALRNCRLEYLQVTECAHTYKNGSCTACGAESSALSGKKLSILGASISTYAGISNNADYNSTIGKNAVYYTEGRYGVYADDTWWMQAAKDLGLELLVNNAWSGSSLLHERNGTVGAYVDRCVQLHNNKGEEPDIIAIQMGTNDFQYYKDTLGTADIDYAALITKNGDGSYTYAVPTTSLEAAAIVLHKISVRYPNAEVYYLNISQRIDGTDALIRSFNAELQQVVEHFGAHIVDIYGSAITMDTFDTYIGDNRVHPNKLGMDAYTEAFKRAVVANTAYQINAHTVSFQLDGVTADYGDNKIVASGDSFSVGLTSADDMNITITMGAEDITASAYHNGVVTIEKVTADVTIFAEYTHKPQAYRWEFDGTELVCVSGDNLLTKNAGTTTDGVFSKTCYALEDAVTLRHDSAWTVEWKCAGTFQNSGSSTGARIFTSTDVNAQYNARYIFKSNKNGIIAMGEKTTTGSHNYGIALGDFGIDWTETHTYRLENRIADDGSNMVWLFVDGVEIGPMNHYYVGTADKNTTSDWLSGKDFVFAYMGTDTHGFTNASIAYIWVSEDSHSHTFENGVCTVCGAEDPDLQSYNGKVISILGGSTCTFDGYIPVADGFNLTHRPRYPQSNLLTDVNDTWWMQVIAELDAKLGVNDSWAGSQVLNTLDSNSGDLGPDAAMASLTRIQNLGANGTPDIILFYGAMNDIGRAVTLGGFDAATAPTQVDLTTMKWDNLADAYVAAIMRMQHYYPDAQIVAMLPGPTASYYTDAQRQAYCEVLKAICEHYSVPTVDLSTCGLTTADMPDGTHPNAAGMDYITAAVLETLLSECQMEVGENVVHSVTHKLTSAESSLSYYKGVSDGKSFATTITGKNITVTVTMGGVDITDQVYMDGKIMISAVTGDIVITAKGVYNADGRLQQLPDNYCCDTNLWTLLDPVNEYYTASGWGNNSNSNYSVTFPVTVGDRIWATSFGAAGVNGYPENAVRITWFSEIGVLKSLAREKVYAEFSEYGYLTVPEGAIALNIPMRTNSDTWEIYILNRGHSYENGVCTGCGAEDSNWVKAMALRYDDHYDIAGKAVEIIDAGRPTSYQVGYGVEENAVLDTAVVALEGDYLVATGIGTAKVTIDGQLYEITVTAAPISFLLLIGQSNMEGNEGDLNQSIVCPDGMVYATYGDRYDMVLENATHYAPSALTGAYRTVNTVGGTDGLADYPVYMLTDEGDGRKGPDSGFAYEWVRQTGEKVWIVNASHGGTSLNVWQPGTTQYEECQAMFGACAETLRREIAAGHFTLSHMAYFWCQGCNDYDKTAQWYVENYLNMHEALKTELAFDHDSNPETQNKTFEFGGIIPVRAGHEWRTYYREGVYTDTTDKSYYESFLDLQMSGPRVAQYWMGNNPELTDIWNVCTIGESWVWMPDGTNGVSEYFQAHYPGGRVDYETQVPQKEAWYTPTTPAAVHDSIHYNQIGYNEVGREAVRNALIYMCINEDYAEPTTVKFVDWTGYREVSQIGACTEVGSATMVVPIVSPITRCKDVTYTLTEGLDYSWYDLTAQAADTVGTLEAVGAAGSVFVEKQKPGALYADHLRQLPESICAGVNLWTALSHDSQYYTVSGWGVHSSGKVFSVTIPVQAGDRIWATSMGANGVNGNTISTGHGIRVTFFGDYGVIVSMSSTDVYAQFSANGYLTAPEGTTAVNVPMWSDSDQNELYILNLPHSGDGICSICGKDTHEHSWSDWQTVLLPSQDAPGQEQRVCAGCGNTENREVAGVWQTLELGKYWLELPENTCCSLDLWKVLEHNEYYYHSGVKWAKHESGKIRSVTIPVSEGDRIFATSFGKYGENGNTVSKADGIRVTWFDAYGVVKTTDPAGTYAEFAENGGYLIAPEGAVAINIAMWNESMDNEIYILNRGHCYENGVCAGCGQLLENVFDLSSDGKVTAFDAQILAEAQAGKRELTDGQQAALVGILPQDILDYILGRFSGTKAND